jgi:Domain of unknown function (DUF222)
MLIAALQEAAQALAGLPVPESGVACLEQADQLLRVSDLARLCAERRIGVADSLGAAQTMGYGSTSAWLRAGGRMNSHAAAGARRNSRQFRRLRATADALAAGSISHAMASAIAAACAELDDDGDARAAEQILLQLAADESATVEKVARAGKYLRQVLDPDGHFDDEERAHRDRYLTARLDENGSMSGSFRLPPKAAAQLQALLDAYARKADAADTRTQTQRNADVLIQLLAQAVSTELLVIVNAETLHDGPDPGGPVSDGRVTDSPDPDSPDPDSPDPDSPVRDNPVPGPRVSDDTRADEGAPARAATTEDACHTCGRATNYDVPGLLLSTGHPLPASHIRGMARTSLLYRMVLDAKSKLLDLGAGVRLVPGWMRRAVLATYDTCAYDDCPVPAKWTEMDHVYPWAQHRRTRLDEIAPACDYHNRDRARHPDKYVARRRPDGRWRITRRILR